MTGKKKPVENPAPLPAAPVQDADNKKTAGTACVSVVIPYCKEYAQGNELLFAIRSWYKNARFPFHITVIGDAEEWMDGENLTLIECPRCSDIPSVDTLHKLWTAQENPEVTGGFIWTNDDIYLMNPVGLEHIRIPKVLGPLRPESYSGHYRAAMRHTMELLAESGLPALNYGTHTPLWFEKERLAAFLPADDPKATEGTLFTSLYFNQCNTVHPVRLDWKTDPFLLPVVSKAPDEKYVERLLQNKVFMNNARSGYSPWLEKFLEKRFPDKSPCEL